jgi:hypothetical protein
MKEFGYFCELSLPSSVLTVLTRHPFDLDFRIVVVWDCDECDLSLNVNEPNGTTLNSFMRNSQGGGLLSRDCPSGFGPIEALYAKANNGKYQVFISIKHPSQTMSVGVLTHIMFNYGRPSEKIQSCFSLLTSETAKQNHLVIEFEVI